MIPYETVRSHLERRHWIGTGGLSWEAMVTLHEQEHHSGGDTHQAPLPLTVVTPMEFDETLASRPRAASFPTETHGEGTAG